MNLAEKVIISAICASIEKGKVKEVYEILKPFIESPIDIDLISIAKIENIIKDDLIVIPRTLKEIRLAKLRKINSVANGEKEFVYEPARITKFFEDYFNGFTYQDVVVDYSKYTEDLDYFSKFA